MFGDNYDKGYFIAHTSGGPIDINLFPEYVSMAAQKESPLFLFINNLSVHLLLVQIQILSLRQPLHLCDFEAIIAVRSAGRSFTVNDEHKLFALYLLHQISSFPLPSYYLPYSHNKLSSRLSHRGRPEA